MTRGGVYDEILPEPEGMKYISEMMRDAFPRAGKAAPRDFTRAMYLFFTMSVYANANV